MYYQKPPKNHLILGSMNRIESNIWEGNISWKTRREQRGRIYLAARRGEKRERRSGWWGAAWRQGGERRDAVEAAMAVFWLLCRCAAILRRPRQMGEALVVVEAGRPHQHGCRLLFCRLPVISSPFFQFGPWPAASVKGFFDSNIFAENFEVWNP